MKKLKSLGIGSIYIGEYPYTYVRGIYLLSELIKRDEYHKLMKMSLAEITKYLEESAYKEEIDKLSVKYSGIALLENALHLNTVRSFEKLKRISSDKIRIIVNGYFRRSDVYNIKTIIRGKFTNMPEEKIKELLLPIGSMDISFLSGLIRKENIKDILYATKFLAMGLVNNAYKEFEKTNNLFELENLLDRNYYEFLLSFSKRIKLRGKRFREFLEAEIYVNNILTILRLKKDNLEKENILKYVVFTGNKKIYDELNSLAELNSVSEIIAAIQKKDRALNKEILAVTNIDNLVELELALKRFLLKKTLQFQNKYPLSIDIVFGYLLGKEMEIRNLSLIVKGKKFGMDEKFIEEQLVV